MSPDHRSGLPTRRHRAIGRRRSIAEGFLGTIVVLGLLLPLPGPFAAASGALRPLNSVPGERAAGMVQATLRPAGTPVAAAKAFNAPPGWRLLFPATHPSARWGSAAAEDPSLGALVLFGGETSAGFLNDTWELKGTPTSGDWVGVAATGTLSPRAFAAVTFDPALGGVVLFGGLGPTGPLDGTWLLSGTRWSELTAAGPSARYSAALTYASGTGGLVLFGGRNASGPLGDTWEYRSGTWVEQFPATAPTHRSGAAFTFDPARGLAVLEGGVGTSAPLGDSYEWNGTDWIAGPALGSATADAADGYSAADGGLIVASGNNSLGPSNDTFSLGPNGSWTMPHLAARLTPRSDAAMAFAPSLGSLVLFGGWNGSGLADTWVFSTSTAPLAWRTEPGVAPPPRTGGALAYDPSDGYTVLFGGVAKGSSGSVDLNDTWIWRTSGWSELSPARSPPARDGAMLAYDPVDGYLVLFGGSASTPINGIVGLNDTWTFRGGVWTPLPPGPSPTARRTAGFAFDVADGYLVLYGGRNGSSASSYTYFHDTWSFVGGAWTKLAPTGKAPPAVSEPQFAFDPSSGVVVLNGGYTTGAVAESYTWTFAADHWTNLSGALGRNIPNARAGAPFLYDPAVGGLALLGGGNATAGFTDVWTFSAEQFAEACENCSLKLKDAGQVGFDEAQGAVLAFGPVSATSTVGETWLNLSLLTASVGASGSTVDLGFPVRLSATVGGGVPPLSVDWTFDDGGFNASVNAVHTFVTAGAHAATFTLTDALGNVSVHVLKITVATSPSVALTATPWGPGTETARFNASVAGGAPPFLYDFRFGDGATENGSSPIVTHTFGAAGSFGASVTVSDFYHQNASASAPTLVLPAVVPTVTIASAALARASPTSIALAAAALDPYGGLNLTWGFGSFPGSAITHLALHATGGNATLSAPKALSFNATAEVWLNVTDAANFSYGTEATFQILPAILGSISEAIVSNSGCPVQTNGTVVELTENISGGAAPYGLQWSVGSSSYSTPSVTLGLTPGTSVPVTLTILDAAGDNYSVSRTVLVPDRSCSPTSALSGRTLLILGGVAGLLVLVIALEVIHLRRLRARRPPPTPAPPTSPPESSEAPDPPPRVD